MFYIYAFLFSVNSDFCSSNPCKHGGTCTNSGTGYSCTCPSGWSGTDCNGEYLHFRQFRTFNFSSRCEAVDGDSVHCDIFLDSVSDVNQHENDDCPIKCKPQRKQFFRRLQRTSDPRDSWCGFVCVWLDINYQPHTERAYGRKRVLQASLPLIGVLAAVVQKSEHSRYYPEIIGTMLR